MSEERVTYKLFEGKVECNLRGNSSKIVFPFILVLWVTINAYHISEEVYAV